MASAWQTICSIYMLITMNGMICDAMENRRGPLRQQFAQSVPPMIQNGVDPGEPLFLTPFIESGELETGKFDIVFLLFHFRNFYE